MKLEPFCLLVGLSDFALVLIVETFSLHIMFARMGIAIDPFGVYVCAPRSILVFISFTICYFKRVLNLVYLVDVFRSYTSHIFRLFPRAPCNRISSHLLYFFKPNNASVISTLQLIKETSELSTISTVKYLGFQHTVFLYNSILTSYQVCDVKLKTFFVNAFILPMVLSLFLLSNLFLDSEKK